MAARSTTPEKRPGIFSQIKMLITFTRKVYSWVPWLLIGILVLGVALGVLVGFLIPPVAVWSIIVWGVAGLMFGLLAAMIALNRLTTRAMYIQIAGHPGRVGQALSTSLPRWNTADQPVQVNPKTQEAVYRTVGKRGIVLVGEGERSRLTRLMNEERMKAQRVAHGVPLHVLYEGDGEAADEVALDQLGKTIKKLPGKVDRATRGAVIQRLDSISGGLSSLPIPKGIDPTKVRAPRPR